MWKKTSPTLSDVRQWLFSSLYCGSGIQEEHSGNGLFLLHNNWVLGWVEWLRQLRRGHNSKASFLSVSCVSGFFSLHVLKLRCSRGRFRSRPGARTEMAGRDGAVQVAVSLCVLAMWLAWDALGHGLLSSQTFHMRVHGSKSRYSKKPS